ncbi:esterase, partial [Pseudoalteromonas ruthenica]
MRDIIHQSVYIDYSEPQTLHLRYIAQDNATGTAIIYMHGAVEKGKIYYPHSNKRLAPFLAK